MIAYGKQKIDMSYFIFSPHAGMTIHLTVYISLAAMLIYILIINRELLACVPK